MRVKVQDKRKLGAPEGGSEASPAPLTQPASKGSLRDDASPPTRTPTGTEAEGGTEAIDTGDEGDGGGEYLEDLRRLQAEFENYRKRMMKEQAAVAGRATARVVERLLPALDNFERALAHGEGGTGVEMVFREVKDALAREGLAEIPAEGVPFDPRVHEAVESIEDDSVEEATCHRVYRRGYRLGEQVIRPAMVVVARPPDHDGDEDITGDEHTAGE